MNTVGILLVLCSQTKEDGEGESAAPTEKTGDKKLTNQFNYSERASQTYNNPYRVRMVQRQQIIKNGQFDIELYMST